MTIREALSICEKALLKYKGGKEAYLDIIDRLERLEEYEDCEYDESEYGEYDEEGE